MQIRRRSPNPNKRNLIYPPVGSRISSSVGGLPFTRHSGIVTGQASLDALIVSLTMVSVKTFALFGLVPVNSGLLKTLFPGMWHVPQACAYTSSPRSAAFKSTSKGYGYAGSPSANGPANNTLSMLTALGSPGDTESEAVLLPSCQG